MFDAILTECEQMRQNRAWILFYNRKQNAYKITHQYVIRLCFEGTYEYVITLDYTWLKISKLMIGHNLLTKFINGKDIARTKFIGTEW